MSYDSQYAGIDARGFEWRELGARIKARNIVAVAGHLPVDSVIEIGAGTGAVLAQLSRLGFADRFYAVEVSSEAVQIIKDRQDIAGLVEARTYDGRHLPYDDKSFDLAVMTHVLEHVGSPLHLLREVARVARYVIIEVPLEDNLYTWVKARVFKRDHRPAVGHVNSFSKRSLLSLLSATGSLEVVTAKLVTLPDESYLFRKAGQPLSLVRLSLLLRSLVRKITRGFYTRVLTDHYIVLAEVR